METIIRCERKMRPGCPWVSVPEGYGYNWRSVLCARGASEWWDVSAARVIDVVVSNDETPSSYKAYVDKGGYLKIYDTSTGKWVRKEIYSWIHTALEGIGATSKGQHGYLGVNIIKWRS